MQAHEASSIVAACEENRKVVAAAAAQPMTVQQAVAKANSLRRCPERILSDAEAKELITTLLSAIEQSPCYLKAVVEGQEVFVFRQHDRAAPRAIKEWAALAEMHGASQAKIVSARSKAERWARQDPESTRWPT